MSDEKKKRKRLRVSREHTTEDGRHEVTLSGEKEDVVAFVGAIQFGMKWVKLTGDGTIGVADVFKGTPSPIDDPEMQNVWCFDPLPPEEPVQMQLLYDDPEMKDPKHEWSREHRAIFLQSIQGYAGRDAYKHRAERLLEAGFSCLRSRRGDDGKYWEIWYLPGVCCGRGPIKDMKTSDEVMKWVLNSIGPGTLTMGGEHWGLSID